MTTVKAATATKPVAIKPVAVKRDAIASLVDKADSTPAAAPAARRAPEVVERAATIKLAAVPMPAARPTRPTPVVVADAASPAGMIASRGSWDAGDGLKQFGGDDGLTINARSDFGLFSLRTNVALYYCTFVVLIAVLLGVSRLVHSRFGMVIRGGRSNGRRMEALGFPMLRYKLTAYVISALVCVLAGVLLANLTKFAAPSYMAWQASGDLIVMIVLGGMGTVLGPVVGALALIVFEEVLTGWTTHWMIVLGPVIVLIVLTANKGLYGYIVERDARRRLP